MKNLTIRSGQGAYPVRFLPRLEESVELLRAVPKAIFLVDRQIEKKYPTFITRVEELGPVVSIHADEEAKTLRGVAQLAGWLQRQHCTRQTVLVAIGGGVIQDLAAFTAHVYYRGISWLYVPTTLLSMSDSCIGAKCCINLNGLKNQLGAFQAPLEVIVCPEFTRTLRDIDVASGYGEILKLALTGSRHHLNDLTGLVERAGLRNPLLAKLICRSLTVKKGIIEQDEYEKDLRRILNFGHTFGHALEAATDHQVPHGLAVAWGLDLVNFIAVQRGWLAEQEFEHIHEFIRTHLSFRLTKPVKAAKLVRLARRDKKVSDNLVNLVVMERPGRLKIVKIPLDAELEAQIDEYIKTRNAFARPRLLRRDLVGARN